MASSSTIDDRSVPSSRIGYAARLDLSSRRFIQVEDFSPSETPHDAHYMNITLNEPVPFDDQQRLNGELLANTIITGGFAKATVAHGLPRKVEERPKISTNLCYMPGCNNTMPQVPCECGFKICNSCLKEANGPTGGCLCPGCNTLYEFKDPEEAMEQATARYPRPELPSMIHAFEVTETDSESLYSRAGHKRNRTIGNASVWSEQANVREKARASNASAQTDGVSISEASEVWIGGKSNRPLTRKSKVDATVLGAYRYNVIIYTTGFHYLGKKLV